MKTTSRVNSTLPHAHPSNIIRKNCVTGSKAKRATLVKWPCTDDKHNSSRQTLLTEHRSCKGCNTTGNTHTYNSHERRASHSSRHRPIYNDDKRSEGEEYGSVRLGSRRKAPREMVSCDLKGGTNDPSHTIRGSGHQPHVDAEPLKRGLSKLRWTERIKSTHDPKDLVGNVSYLSISFTHTRTHARARTCVSTAE